MATVACACCGCEISAEASYCGICQEQSIVARSAYWVSYPLTDYERRRAREQGCPHRVAEYDNATR